MSNQYYAIAKLQERLSANSYARAHVDRIARAGKALSDVANARAGEHPAQHATRLGKMSKQYAEAVQAARAEIEKGEWGGRGALADEFRERCNVSCDQFASAIVQRFATAEHKDRVQWLGQIAEDGDDRSLAALMGAPKFVTGLDPDMLAKHRDVLEEKHAPDIAEKRRQFDNDVQTAKAVLQAADALAISVTQATTGDAVTAAGQIASAELVFNESLSSEQ